MKLLSAFVATCALLVPQVRAQITVLNGASFDSAQPIAPGAFATVFGNALCSSTQVADWMAPGQLPTTLGGCSVTVGSVPAMIQYVSSGQINFIMPMNVGSGQISVTVNSGSQVWTGTAVAAPAGPGIFALNGMGMGEGALLNATMWKMGPFSTTTNGNPTYVALYCTGLDLAAKPVVTIGGVPVEVTWFGNAPGYAGLQQINFMLPAGMAGVGRAPVTVTSNGQVSNVTFMHLLPTTGMMQGMPGWGQGMMVGENMGRGHEMSFMAFNPANNTVLVTDENDDAVRVLSLTSNSTIATITLPSGSQSHAIAVNANGSLAAATLSAKAAVALIDLAQNKVVAVVGTGYYPSRVTFTGTLLLVTNSASGSVSVVDTNTKVVSQTITTGLGASGIAVGGGAAVVANMQAGTISLINLSNFSVGNVVLPAGSRPNEVAVNAAGTKAVVTTPMTNGFVVVDLATKNFTQVGTSGWNGMGPRAVAIGGNTAYVANQMNASVTVADLASATVQKTFSVDPGPMALAVNAAKNQLLVLAEGTGVVDVVDLNTSTITARLNAGDTERPDHFQMPFVTSISPNSGTVGSTLTITIKGSDLDAAKRLDFVVATSVGMGGMMGAQDGGFGQTDPNIKVSNFQVNASGTQITASVQILSAATIGARQIRLQTANAPVMGMMNGSAVFNITK